MGKRQKAREDHRKKEREKNVSEWTCLGGRCAQVFAPFLFQIFSILYLFPVDSVLPDLLRLHIKAPEMRRNMYTFPYAYKYA